LLAERRTALQYTGLIYEIVNSYAGNGEVRHRP
jgi:hypothetical protein